MKMRMTKCLAGISGAIILMSAACLASSSAFAQTTGAAEETARRAAPSEPRITGIRIVKGSGAATDKLIIDFVGDEPELSMQTADGRLQVSLKGVVLPDSVSRSINGGASAQVVASISAASLGGGVELTVTPKVKAWSYAAAQGRRAITIELTAAAVQPAEAVAIAAAVPLAAVPPVPAVPAVAQAGEEPDAEGKPVLASKTPRLKPCIECHEQFFTVVRSKHFVKGDARTPKGSEAECTGCHGDTSEHNKRPRVKGLVPIVFGSKAPAGPQNDACLSCHQSGPRILWQGSKHERTQTACANCHKAHSTKDPVVVAETQAGVCFECHKDRRAEMFRTSVHARKTGFFSCSSCHQPHGSPTRALLAKNTVNDTCFTCHADKRGPFLWEHRSAQDDCMNCHSPHGTNNPPMLKARMPFLCQQCHMNTGHASTAFSGAQLTNLAGPNAERFVGRSCTNCHAKIHGTNHPSGARLQR
jgi:DmsE family decaheme c-type cytochrome